MVSTKQRRKKDEFAAFSIVKPTGCTNVSNLFYFGMTLHVSDGLSFHHQEFKTVHTATKQMPVAVCAVLNS